MFKVPKISNLNSIPSTPRVSPDHVGGGTCKHQEHSKTKYQDNGLCNLFFGRRHMQTLFLSLTVFCYNSSSPDGHLLLRRLHTQSPTVSVLSAGAHLVECGRICLQLLHLLRVYAAHLTLWPSISGKWRFPAQLQQWCNFLLQRCGLPRSEGAHSAGRLHSLFLTLCVLLLQLHTEPLHGCRVEVFDQATSKWPLPTAWQWGRTSHWHGNCPRSGTVCLWFFTKMTDPMLVYMRNWRASSLLCSLQSFSSCSTLVSMPSSGIAGWRTSLICTPSRPRWPPLLTSTFQSPTSSELPARQATSLCTSAG